MTLKKSLLASIIAAGILAAPTALADGKLVILHTNDTHSAIDPDSDGLGGVLRRKVLIDSVRAAEPNVLLIDAGDVVQGTLYFNIYGGKIEQELMNALGYDIRILGNHEFDNGVDSLAKVLAISRALNISTNYDLSASPLAPMFKPYDIRQVGDRRFGIIGINLDPKGMIMEGAYDGVVYKDAVEAANSAAWWLKNIEKVDAVIAISHIGYDVTPPGDLMLAQNSDNIDIIIGGHSHDLILPAPTGKNPYASRVKNRQGRDVLVTQVGKSGKNIGQINIDLDDLSSEYSVISVNSRLDNRIDPATAAIIEPYRAGVDSLMNIAKVGRSAVDLAQNSQALLNFVSDFIYDRGTQLADNVDFAITNKGGIRRGLHKGNITEGELISMMPFNNYVTVIDIKGEELLPAFTQMGRVGGNGISDHVRITYNGETFEPETVIINGEPLERERVYRVATINYLANGGDYMPSLMNHTDVATANTRVYDDLIAYFVSGKAKGKKINPPTEQRMTAK